MIWFMIFLIFVLGMEQKIEREKISLEAIEETYLFLNFAVLGIFICFQIGKVIIKAIPIYKQFKNKRAQTV